MRLILNFLLIFFLKFVFNAFLTRLSQYDEPVEDDNPNEYHQEMDALIIAFDVTQAKSFQFLQSQKWCEKENLSHAVKVLVALKRYEIMNTKEIKCKLEKAI